jgi:SpoVK/Ycf46/Vps4 family AAA+-type ATPase
MNETIGIDDLFEHRTSFPDLGAMKRFASLVGIDEAKSRLERALGIIVNPASLAEWSKKCHQAKIGLLDFVERRPPLVILAGDVGTGKTELATTVGDPVARRENIDITLFPLSLATRGSGKVGEMTQLLSAAFDETYKAAHKLKGKGGSKARGAIILLVDEADAVVQSRESAQMHHEDRAGVNAFIRGVDRLAEQHLPAAVILCTNRLSSIDPAVQRRAAEIFVFERPNEEQRLAVLQPPLAEIGFSQKEIAEVVKSTGKTKERDYGFTYSDLTQRLLPTLVIDAYPNDPVTYKRTREIISELVPTAPFKEVRLHDNK